MQKGNMDLIDPEAAEMEDLARRYLPSRIPQEAMEQRSELLP